MSVGGGGLAALARLRRLEEEAAARHLAAELAGAGAFRDRLAAAAAEWPVGPAEALACAARAIGRLRAGQKRAAVRVALAREQLATAAGRRRAVEAALERQRAEEARAAERRAEAEADDRGPGRLGGI